MESLNIKGDAIIIASPLLVFYAIQNLNHSGFKLKTNVNKHKCQYQLLVYFRLL
jgi:hypothetical protein